MAYYCEQAAIQLAQKPRGCHLVTDLIDRQLQQTVHQVKAGTCTLVLQHTTAALSVNERHDANARFDMVMLQDRLVRLSDEDHENSDDKPAQMLANVVGNSVTIPITDGRLVFGTWQGIYLNEYTLSGKPRTIIATITGRSKE